MATLNYRESGTGPTLILFHGFPMHQHVWDNFAEKLSASFQVVTLDLPGFGKTPGLPDGFSLEDVALTVHAWIKEKKYTHPIVIGHSLGGYVTLALADHDIDIMAGMCLFHSTALADTNEKKQSRNKVLEFIEKQGVQAFTSNFIAQLYTDSKHSSITKVKNIAVQSSKETVTGYIKAMRDRKDQTGVLRRFPGPILFLAGENDQGIPPDSIQRQVTLNVNAEAIILPEVAHMGMFESEKACVKSIEKFVEKCVVTF